MATRARRAGSERGQRPREHGGGPGARGRRRRRRGGSVSSSRRRVAPAQVREGRTEGRAGRGAGGGSGARAPQPPWPRRVVVARQALTRLPFVPRHGRRAVGGPGAAAMEESA